MYVHKALSSKMWLLLKECWIRTIVACVHKDRESCSPSVWTEPAWSMILQPIRRIHLLQKPVRTDLLLPTLTHSFPSEPACINVPAMHHRVCDQTALYFSYITHARIGVSVRCWKGSYVILHGATDEHCSTTTDVRLAHVCPMCRALNSCKDKQCWLEWHLT